MFSYSLTNYKVADAAVCNEYRLDQKQLHMLNKHRLT